MFPELVGIFEQKNQPNKNYHKYWQQETPEGVMGSTPPNTDPANGGQP